MSKRVDALAGALASIQGLSDGEREAVVELLKVGRIRVADGRAGAATGVAALGSRGFTWPEFDRWHAIFTSSGTFPASWKGLHEDPSARTSPAASAAYHLRKVDLLLDWLDMLRRGATALHHYTRQGIRARIVQQGDGLRCPVCESFNGREVAQGRGTMPPIHPGCRCVLMAVTAAPFDEAMGPRARHRLRSSFERLAG